MSTLDVAIELAGNNPSGDYKPFVVAFGGTLSPNSSTEKALHIALEGAVQGGAEVELIRGPALEMPIYAWERSERTPQADYLVAALRRADGVIIGSPGYHGGISGLVKNALDYTEDMAQDEWPYFHGRPVGSVATGAGWQGAVATMMALRTIVHALRGWNTPLGVAINTSGKVFDEQGRCLDPKIETLLLAMGQEVAQAARVRAMMQNTRSAGQS